MVVKWEKGKGKWGEVEGRGSEWKWESMRKKLSRTAFGKELLLLLFIHSLIYLFIYLTLKEAVKGQKIYI